MAYEVDALGHGLAVSIVPQVIQYWQALAGSYLGPGRARRFVDTDTDKIDGTVTVGGGPWSLAGWIKTTDDTQYMFGLYDPSDQGRFAMLMTAAGLARTQIVTDAGSGDAKDSSAAVNDGAWHFLAMAVTSDTLYLWVDATAETPLAHTRTLPSPTNLTLGYWNNTAPYNGQYYLGDIDEVSFWNGTAITDADAFALHQLGVDRTKQYFDGTNFGDPTVTAPTHHYSLSETKNPGDIGKDEIGGEDLTDTGTADVEGIPAGD